MGIFEEMAESIIGGKAPKVEELANTALEQGEKPADILSKGLIAGMEVIGRRFKNNEVYVPEVLIAARAMKAGMAILKPKLIESGVKAQAKCIIGTVKGDLHDIGKNLVSMMYEGAGFDVVDIGVDCSPEKFVEAIKENEPDMVAMSALLTTTMVNMKEVLNAIKASDMKVKTIIGGAPVTQNFADEVGADGYAPDAASAVDVTKTLLGL